MIAPLFLVLTTQVGDSPQLRTLLPNDAVVWCENRRSPYVSIQLFLTNKGMPDTVETFGYRHLLEHIAARAIPGHDRQIEANGGLFEASTTRDWMNFEWKVPTDKVDLAFKGLKTLLGGFPVSEQSIQLESKTIKHELALENPTTVFSNEAWTELYGVAGLGSNGSIETLSKATPLELRRLWADLTKADRVVISVSGTIDVKQTTAAAKEILMSLKPSSGTSWNSRSLSNSYGHSDRLALPVASIDSRAGLASLMVTFAVASKLSQPYVVYTPSLRPHLALVGSYNESEVISESLKGEDAASMFRAGRNYALGWVQISQNSASSSARFNGSLLALNPTVRPKKLAEEIPYVTFSEFSRAYSIMRAVSK